LKHAVATFLVHLAYFINANAYIPGSPKALSLPTGIGIVVVDPKAIIKASKNPKAIIRVLFVVWSESCSYSSF